MDYRTRSLDSTLTRYMDAFGGVLIEGPKGCGKTSTGLQRAASSIRLDSSPQLVELASLNPSALLTGEAPRLIDEWQLAPELWNLIRHEIDNRQSRGQFIVSGSATPDDDATRHSGAGRIGRLRMQTMSLAERGSTSREVTLRDLRESKRIEGVSPLTYTNLAEEAVRGGWPALLEASTDAATIFNRSYVDDLCSSDIQLAVGTRHDPVRMHRLIRSLARNTASEVTLANIARDVSGDGSDLTPQSVRSYLDALARVFALDELPAWSVSLRSRSRLRTKPKLALSDTGLICAALGVGSTRLARDPEFFGQVFEALAIHDLRVLASVEDAQVYHYRDNTGLEIDVVLELSNSRWAAIEVKLGSSKVPDAERNLTDLRDRRVDVAKVGEPSFLAVVTGTQYAYTLPSGVHVVPLGVLDL